ncbi:MAG: hypothetical protein NZ821_06020 [Gloeomargarita sp. SKYB31]|nr:hypothetical protein [Gloeomargarita sp. SKYB31]
MTNLQYLYPGQQQVPASEWNKHVDLLQRQQVPAAGLSGPASVQVPPQDTQEIFYGITGPDPNNWYPDEFDPNTQQPPNIYPVWRYHIQWKPPTGNPLDPPGTNQVPIESFGLPYVYAALWPTVRTFGQGRIPPGRPVTLAFREGRWWIIDGADTYVEGVLQENLYACQSARLRTAAGYEITLHDVYGRVLDWYSAQRDDRGYYLAQDTSVLARYMPEHNKWALWWPISCPTPPGSGGSDGSGSSGGSGGSAPPGGGCGGVTTNVEVYGPSIVRIGDHICISKYTLQFVNGCLTGVLGGNFDCFYVCCDGQSSSGSSSSSDSSDSSQSGSGSANVYTLFRRCDQLSGDFYAEGDYTSYPVWRISNGVCFYQVGTGPVPSGVVIQPVSGYANCQECEAGGSGWEPGQPCALCAQGTTPKQIKITVSGIQNGTFCQNCTQFNGTFILTQRPDDPCKYQYLFDSSCMPNYNAAWNFEIWGSYFRVKLFDGYYERMLTWDRQSGSPCHPITLQGQFTSEHNTPNCTLAGANVSVESL